MERTESPVTNSPGDVDRNGDIVGRCGKFGTALEPEPYVERPGLDERIASTGADVEGVRRMLGVPRFTMVDPYELAGGPS